MSACAAPVFPTNSTRVWKGEVSWALTPQYDKLSTPRAARFRKGSMLARRSPNRTDIFKLGKLLTFVFCVDSACAGSYPLRSVASLIQPASGRCL
jgi:hypothetical protein